MLDGVTERLNVRRVTDALKAAKDQDAWKVMTTPTLISRAPD